MCRTGVGCVDLVVDKSCFVNLQLREGCLVWGLGSRIEDGSGHQFLQWLTSIALHSPASVFEACLMMSWMLWKNRNENIWIGPVARLSQVAQVGIKEG